MSGAPAQVRLGENARGCLDHGLDIILNHGFYGFGVLIKVLRFLDLKLGLFLVVVKNADIFGRGRIKVQAAYRFAVVVIHNDRTVALGIAYSHPGLCLLSSSAKSKVSPNRPGLSS